MPDPDAAFRAALASGLRREAALIEHPAPRLAGQLRAQADAAEMAPATHALDDETRAFCNASARGALLAAGETRDAAVAERLRLYARRMAD